MADVTQSILLFLALRFKFIPAKWKANPAKLSINVCKVQLYQRKRKQRDKIRKTELTINVERTDAPSTRNN